MSCCYDFHGMLPERAFQRIGGRMTYEGGGKKSKAPPPPDYTPVAQASKEAARIGAAQADRVLAESRRQYERNIELDQPIIDAQLEMMKSAQKQGDEYYDYWKTKAQPVEDSLNADAMASGGTVAQESAATSAAATTRSEQAQQVSMMLRAGLRSGWSPAKMAAFAGSMARGNSAVTAGAMTNARDKEKQLGFAKKMDVAGLYRGMPGASIGAYGSANQSGNSAAGNGMAAGNALMAGTNAAAGLTMQGQGLRIQGLSSILGAQTSAYNTGAQAAASQQSGMFGLLGAGMGAAATIYA